MRPLMPLDEHTHTRPAASSQWWRHLHQHRSLNLDLSAKLGIAFIALLFHLSGALWVAKTTPFPSTIDEWQHLSYVREMSNAPHLFPRFDTLRTLDNRVGGFTTKPNIMSHPSPYYHVMALIDDPTAPTEMRLKVLRAANLVLSGLGVILILCTGMMLLPNLAGFALFAAILVMFPKLAVVGGLINNDNLGVLAAGLCFLGLARLQNGGSKGVGILLGLGIMLAGWAKFTVLVMIGFTLIAGELLRLGEAQDRQRRLVLGIAGAIGAVGFIPTIQNLFAYRMLFYVYLSPTHKSPAIAEHPGLEFLHHTGGFLYRMVLKWPALEPAHWIQIVGLGGGVAAVLAFMLAEFRGRWRSGGAASTPAANRLATAYGLSIMLTLVVQLAYGWWIYQTNGDLSFAQPRYYYAVWPGLALAITLALRLLPPGRPRGYVCICLLAGLAVSTVQFAIMISALKGTPLVPH